MKKRYLLFILVCITAWWGCTQPGKADPFQKKITQKKALEEFKTFRSILESSHPSLYVYLPEKKFNRLFDSIANTISGDMTVGELFSKYTFITNETGCSHTFIDVSDEMYDSLLTKSFFFPLGVKLIDNKLLVNTAGEELPQGTEIVSINNRPVKEILGELMKYESVEGTHRNTQRKLTAESFALNYFYAFGAPGSFTVSYTDTLGWAGNTIVYPITLNDWMNVKKLHTYYFDRTLCDYDLDINEAKGYALMRIATFSFDEIERQEGFENFCRNSFELLKLKKNIHSLVIDVRENTGGDLYNSSLLFSYLAKEKFKEFEYADSRINSIPNEDLLEKNFYMSDKDEVNEKLSEQFRLSPSTVKYKLTDSLIDQWAPDKNAFRGNVYVITNARVASAASYFSVMVKNSGTGKIIGEETTGGSYSGNGFTSLKYTLPYSGLNLTFPYVHLIYTYKENKNNGRGLLPNFDVPDSYESFKKNNDNQLMFISDSIIAKKTR
ncbi:MAG: S41 family peptidase [Ferruginibacter sp.]